MGAPLLKVGDLVRHNADGIAKHSPAWKSKSARYVLIQPPFYAPPDERYDAHGWFVLAAPVCDAEEAVDYENDHDSIADFRAQTDYNGVRAVYLCCDEIESDEPPARESVPDAAVGLTPSLHRHDWIVYDPYKNGAVHATCSFCGHGVQLA